MPASRPESHGGAHFALPYRVSGVREGLEENALHGEQRLLESAREGADHGERFAHLD